MRVGAERAEVTAEEVIRELKKLGFSCIGNVVDWHNETVEITTESEDGKETKTVLVPRVTIIAKADLEKGALDAIAEVSQRANGALRVKMHDKSQPSVMQMAGHTLSAVDAFRNRRGACSLRGRRASSALRLYGKEVVVPARGILSSRCPVFH